MLNAECRVLATLRYPHDLEWERGMSRFKAPRRVGDTYASTTNNTGYPTDETVLKESIRSAKKPMRQFWGELRTATALEADCVTIEGLAQETDTSVVDGNAGFSETSLVFLEVCHLTSEGNTQFVYFVVASMTSRFFGKQVSGSMSEDKGEQR